jgi:hypothetical protein
MHRLEVRRAEARIASSHLKRTVTQDFMQVKDSAAAHHARGEFVLICANDMSISPFVPIVKSACY